jgi:hypothetical protein
VLLVLVVSELGVLLDGMYGIRSTLKWGGCTCAGKAPWFCSACFPVVTRPFTDCKYSKGVLQPYANGADVGCTLVERATRNRLADCVCVLLLHMQLQTVQG